MNYTTLSYSVLSFFLFTLLILTDIGYSQLTDVTQTTPTVPGGQIGKSLEQQIGTGQGDELTPGSSIYLINRDPARPIRRGRQIFQRKFTENQGQGPRVSGDSEGNIQDDPKFGAGLSDSCAACHGRPRGAAGFGGDVATRPGSRDAPHLFGLGLVEMLADEMTKELREIREEALNIAANNGSNIKMNLEAKGVEFGQIIAKPNGEIDATDIEGVDPDLRVKPFFHHGATTSIREFIIGAFKAEMGMESPDPILCAVTDPDNPQSQVSPAGMEFDPVLDFFERPPVCDANEDGDSDGVVNEIDPAIVDHVEFYLLNYFKPATGKTNRKTNKGLRTMKRIGCTGCHVQDLEIETDRRVADVETKFNRQQGIINRLFATATTLFNIEEDGEEFPKLVSQGNSFVVENVFSDFKRHDLGSAFHERQYDGTLITEFVTEPLWGVGSTSPYGHDGRSINLEEVILRHGGEAQSSKRRFRRLGGDRKREVIEYLQTLILFPPDDTASNLNPGNPNTNNPQDPSEHGSINLGELFQIESEGPE